LSTANPVRAGVKTDVKFYSLRSIILFASVDISRYILVVDTSVLAKNNIGRRKYRISKRGPGALLANKVYGSLVLARVASSIVHLHVHVGGERPTYGRRASSLHFRTQLTIDFNR
jgi:hypothetical protein